MKQVKKRTFFKREGNVFYRFKEGKLTIIRLAESNLLDKTSIEHGVMCAPTIRKVKTLPPSNIQEFKEAFSLAIKTIR